MRLKTFILYAFIPFALGACTNWLDVAPDDQVNENTLFSKADGYRNALNGIYKNMSSTQMYGQALSYGAVEVLGHPYQRYELMQPNTHLYDYNYTSTGAKSLIENIWSKSYTAIANCNNLIANTEEADPAIFPENILEKNLILGEAYALRAFIHFDMLRLFAPSKKMDDQKTYIPYYDKKKSTYEPHLTMDQVLEKVKQDLLKAKDLVATFDTLAERKPYLLTNQRIGGKGDEGYNNRLTDVFYAYRGYRMNYYAIVATLARVYSWAGELDKAYEAAMEIINARYGAYYFSFNSPSMYHSNRKMTDELVFVLSRQTLIEEYENYIPGSGIGDHDKFVIDLYQIGWSRGEMADARFTNFLSIQNYNYYSTKYTKQEGSTLGEDIIPMIRLSEMYFIASEYLYKNGMTSEAVQLLVDVRYNRGVLNNSSFTSTIRDESSFEKALVSEVQKDLLGEGQAFYWYKKFNLDISYKTPAYVLPTPDNENIF